MHCGMFLLFNLFRCLQCSQISSLILDGVSLSFCYFLKTSMCQLLQMSASKSRWFVLGSGHFL